MDNVDSWHCLIVLFKLIVSDLGMSKDRRSLKVNNDNYQKMKQAARQMHELLTNF